jgi:hypothetical protein
MSLVPPAAPDAGPRSAAGWRHLGVNVRLAMSKQRLPPSLYLDSHFKLFSLTSTPSLLLPLEDF